jgi:hypothetical protein
VNRLAQLTFLVVARPPRLNDGRVARMAAVVACLLLLAPGCGAFTRPPQPTAGELTDIVNALVRRNMTITNQVAGDPGCGEYISSSLYRNAVRYDVSPPGDPNSYAVHVFGWKSQATFDADKQEFDACVRGVASFTIGGVDTVEHLPWRAFGAGWPPALKDAVDAALSEAGGIPAPQEPQ